MNLIIILILINSIAQLEHTVDSILGITVNQKNYQKVSFDYHNLILPIDSYKHEVLSI